MISAPRSMSFPRGRERQSNGDVGPVLDRGGAVNAERKHVRRMADLVFYGGIFESCAYALRQQFMLAIGTKQAGMGRGHYRRDEGIPSGPHNTARTLPGMALIAPVRPASFRKAYGRVCVVASSL